ncbi:MAG TPA: phosphatase PAP2 family protein [Chitinophagaceae bacterium]|nr:phosphatase PAP2 family protein [Chitinophagaceae bacterium]
MLIITFFANNSCRAQGHIRTDSSFTTKFSPPETTISAKSFIIPGILVTVGALGKSGSFIISDKKIKEERDESFRGFYTSVDNYLQFAPIAAGYAIALSNKKYNVWRYTEKMLLGEVVMNAFVQPLKRLTKEGRPDTGSPNSFPSGHTAQAFCGATIFCDEFARHKFWLAATIYSSASAVGVLRVLNNRHWAGDVVAGAGFGMLSAKISEWIMAPRNKSRHGSIL